jgi:hypothetical protein
LNDTVGAPSSSTSIAYFGEPTTNSPFGAWSCTT